MRVATRALQLGGARDFALAAFRQVFVAGRDLSLAAEVADAAAACGLDPDAVLAGAATDPVKRALREATDQAADLGVRGVPTLGLGPRLFFGHDRLKEAARAARA